VLGDTLKSGKTSFITNKIKANINSAKLVEQILSTFVDISA